VQLRNDDALGTVDDERSVVGHQRDLAKENVLFFNVADGRRSSLYILVENRQPDLYFERDAVRHSAFLTFLLIVLVLEADRFTAVVAEIWPYGIERAAIVTENLCRVERVNLDLGTAVLTICTQVLEALEVAAFALPVADLVLNKFQRCCLTKVGNRKDRSKYRLQAGLVALFGDQVHLKKAVIRLSLDLNKIWDLCGSVDLGKIHALGRLARSPSQAVIA